jgi:4-hydroxy-tetrahydrodipicolinate reductase
MKIIKDASTQIPIVFASNFSTGVNLLWKVLADIGSAIPADYDIEIVEAHHRFKKDAPSGTALSTAKVIQNVRAGEVPMHAVRAGGIVGEHKVICASLGDVLEFKHTAISRDTFSEGAFRACKWIIGKTPGLYSMQDVLFS